ncbi:MAG: 50S ribosomal protein L15 [Alphaproteobacteria bacterium]|nr:MAG: 50S ribosomal protein L15 [Alphaproteobacteria bacterium]
MLLNTIKDNCNSRSKSKRVGRGIGSGKGKTSGSGQKGQKARTGVALKGYEGGQMPYYRRLPKRGFTNRNMIVFDVINLGALSQAVTEKRIDGSKPVTVDVLKAAGMLNRHAKTFKVLAKGDLTHPLVLQTAHYSEAAKEAILKSKGEILSPVDNNTNESISKSS